MDFTIQRLQFYLYITALHACRLVAYDQAFLFPSLYRQFMQYIIDERIDLSGLCLSKSRLFTFLGNEFSELLASFCVDRSVGTIFHRAKADMNVLLSHCLQANSCCSPISLNYDTVSLNSKVDQLINYQKGQNDDRSMKTAFDIDRFVNTVCSVAPELWEHAFILTLSVNEHRGRSACVSESSFAGHVKHIHRAYLVSLVLFITNEYYYPFHVALSDIIESCGGSADRFGLAASVDTLKTYQPFYITR